MGSTQSLKVMRKVPALTLTLRHLLVEGFQSNKSSISLGYVGSWHESCEDMGLHNALKYFVFLLDRGRGVHEDHDALEVNRLELQTSHANSLTLVVYPYREWDAEHNR